MCSLFFFLSGSLFAQWYELPAPTSPYGPFVECVGGECLPCGIAYPAGNGVIIYDVHCFEDYSGESEDYEIMESMNDLATATSVIDINDLHGSCGYFNSFNGSTTALDIWEGGIITSRLCYTSTNFSTINNMSAFIADFGGPIAITNSFIYVVSQNSLGYGNDSVFISQTNISANTCKHISSYKDSGLGKLIFINDSIGFLVSCQRGIPNTNRLLQTTNYGTTWNDFLYDSLHNITDYCFPSLDTAYVIFDNDSILKTTDGGSMWNKLPIPIGTLQCVQFANGQIGYVGGASGFLIKTTDGGTTWTTQNITDANTIVSLYTFGTSVAYFVDNYKNIFKNQPPLTNSDSADTVDANTLNNSFSLFPDPNNGTFSVFLENNPSNPVIEIYNTLGQKVYSYSLQGQLTEISLIKPTKGIYFYRVLNPSGGIISKGKFIIE